MSVSSGSEMEDNKNEVKSEQVENESKEVPQGHIFNVAKGKQPNPSNLLTVTLKIENHTIIGI